MKKLEDLSRKNIFKVPDGYFEKLPGIIQARVAKPEPKTWFAPALKFAMPVVALVIAITIWYNSGQGVSLEDQLNEIQTEQLIAYLEANDMTEDFSTEEVTFSEDELYDLEEVVFSSMEPIDIAVEELSVEPDNF